MNNVKVECFVYGPCRLGDFTLLADSSHDSKTQVQGYYECKCIIIQTNLHEDLPEFCPSHNRKLTNVLVC